MNKNFYFVLVACCSVIYSVEGLECYKCGYLDKAKIGLRHRNRLIYVTDDILDPSCNLGSHPKENFAVTCDEQIYGKNPSCITASVKARGSLITTRTCAQEDPELTMGCKEWAFDDLRNSGLSENIKNVLANSSSFEEYYGVTLCACNSSRCNPNTDNLPKWNWYMWPFLLVIVIALGILLYFLKRMKK